MISDPSATIAAPPPLTEHDVIARIVDQAPELSESQRSNLAALLRGGAR